MDNEPDWLALIAEIRHEFSLRGKKSRGPGNLTDKEKRELEQLQQSWIAGKLKKINALLPRVLSLLDVSDDWLRQMKFRHKTESAGGIPLEAVQYNDIHHLPSSLWLMVPSENQSFIGFVYDRNPSIPSTADPILEKDFGLLDTRAFLEFWEPILLVLETKEGLLRKMIRVVG